MDIILVGSVEYMRFPPKHKAPPLGLLVIREVLKPYFDVEIADFDHMCSLNQLHYGETIEENIKIFTEHIISRKPKAVGFHTRCDSFDISIRIAQKVKESTPDIKIVFGGPHATLTFETCLESFTFIDAISIGESELSVRDLFESLLYDKDLKDVCGIAYRINGTIVTNKPNTVISGKQLSRNRVLDYFPYFSADSDEVGVSIPIEGGRGCPYNCTFCATSIVWKREFRIKTVDALLEEIEYCHKKYSAKHFEIHHDFFTCNRKHIEEFCIRVTNDGLSYSWSCSSRVDVLDRELIMLLKQSGCRNIFFGIETGSPRLQKKINKNLNLANALEVIDGCINAGLNTTVSFIYGLPEESFDDFEKTVSFIETLIKRKSTLLIIQLHNFMIFPGTTDYKKAKNVMYFDKNKLGFVSYFKKFDCTSSRLIESHPSIFSHFYMFDTEARVKYPLLEMLVLLLVSAMQFFPLSVAYMVTKEGLLRLHQRFAPELVALYKEKTSTEALVDHTWTVSSKLIKVFIKSYKDRSLDDKMEFEKLLFGYELEFYNYVISRKEEPCVLTITFDVLEAHHHAKYVKDVQYVRFSRKGSKYSRVVLPSIYGKIYDIPHNLAEVVKCHNVESVESLLH